MRILYYLNSYASSKYGLKRKQVPRNQQYCPPQVPYAVCNEYSIRTQHNTVESMPHDQIGCLLQEMSSQNSNCEVANYQCIYRMIKIFEKYAISNNVVTQYTGTGQTFAYYAWHPAYKICLVVVVYHNLICYSGKRRNEFFSLLLTHKKDSIDTACFHSVKDISEGI